MIVAVDPRYFRPTKVEALFGDPSKATAENGERFVNDCVAKIADFIIEFSKIKSAPDPKKFGIELNQLKNTVNELINQKSKNVSLKIVKMFI